MEYLTLSYLHGIRSEKGHLAWRYHSCRAHKWVQAGPLKKWYMNMVSFQCLSSWVNIQISTDTHFLLFFFCINVADFMCFDGLIPNVMFLYGPNNHKTTNTYTITLGGSCWELGFSGGGKSCNGVGVCGFIVI